MLKIKHHETKPETYTVTHTQPTVTYVITSINDVQDSAYRSGTFYSHSVYCRKTM